MGWVTGVTIAAGHSSDSHSSSEREEEEPNNGSQFEPKTLTQSNRRRAQVCRIVEFGHFSRVLCGHQCEMNVHLAVAIPKFLYPIWFEESEAFRNIPVVIMSSENVPSRINRCLEEGAEEFFLKPVRLSDVDRLRPHMLRAKYGQQKQGLLQECQKPEPKPKQQQQQQQPQQLQQHQQKQEEEQQQQTQQQQQLQHHNNNKRKSMDEELSSERTRARYNGITTAV